jgi:hypothetical protein
VINEALEAIHEPIRKRWVECLEQFDGPLRSLENEYHLTTRRSLLAKNVLFDEPIEVILERASRDTDAVGHITRPRIPVSEEVDENVSRSLPSS